jgi:MerR family copper efflux transcriptional regulator
METPSMNIGQASLASGVSAKMIRLYESLGLLPPAPRTDAGYRVYDDASVHTLRFIRRARDLGFGMKEIDTLLGLWRNRRRASADVKRIAQTHADDLQRRIDEMQAMKRTLEHLAHCCQGNGRPDCPILDDLAGGRA